MGKNLLESTLHIEDMKNPNWRSRKGEPTVWIDVSGSTILLNGQPSSGQILLGYIQTPVAMVNPTDSPDPSIPQAFHQYLKFAAAAWLLVQSGQAKDLAKAGDYYKRFTVGIGLGELEMAMEVRR